ncbi:MAG TPA: TonB family protein [Rubricoccaceae bacterium]|nr:TonB family protein [Rubricoccaceae bacterium]
MRLALLLLLFAPSTAAQPSISFVGFDFARLQNAAEMREALAEAVYPEDAREAGIQGDVLVLFVADTTGRIIRAVPARRRGGLEEAAAALVRQMRIIPPRIGGVPAELRSQVVVRFTLDESR